MTNRENFLSLVRRQGFEWVPVEFVLCPALIEQVKERFGTEDYEKLFNFPWRRVEDIRLQDVDTGKFHEFYETPIAQGGFLDHWGIGYERSPNSMHMTHMRHPLENMTTVEELKKYPFPDFTNGTNEHQKQQVEELVEQDLIALGDMQITLWETAWYMRSMEELFCDMMEDSDIAHYLFDKVLEINKIRAASFVKAGVDVLYFGDDIGMQHTTMMSTELYCEWIKPRLKELIDYVKAINPNVIIFYHSCGYIEPFIPHLIEAGVDVLTPIQSECMDFSALAEKYGDKISFHGTVGTQTVMPFGTPQEVIEVVEKHLDKVGGGGGLFVAPTHVIEPEVPLENVLAYVQACKDYKPSVE